MTGQIEHGARIRRTGEDAAAIAEVLERFGPDDAVHHCGDWRVGDLIRHLGQVHRWATEVVRTGRVAKGVGDGADSGLSLSSWLRQGADELCSVLAETPPDSECWTFGRPPAQAGFWARRQMVETAVHRFDVEDAVGEPAAVPFAVATDGIGEVVDFLFPRQVEAGRANPWPGAVLLSATDGAGQWTLGEAEPAAQVSGSASDLLLMLWKRPHRPLNFDGDPAAITALKETALTP